VRFITLCIIDDKINSLHRMTKSIDDALQLSDIYGVEKMDLGMAVVLFLIRAITILLDCTLEDWSFLVTSEDQFVKGGFQYMDVDIESEMCNNRSRNVKKLRQTNAFMALEVVENMCSSKFVQVSLRLVHLNWCVYFLPLVFISCVFIFLGFLLIYLLDPYWVLYIHKPVFATSGKKTCIEHASNY
jgi:hypothetical protein